MPRLVCFFLIPGFFCQIAWAQPTLDLRHSKWGALLGQTLVVKQNGQVTRLDYGLLKSKNSQLSAYLQDLSKVSESEFKSLNRQDQMAFLINAYNAAMARLVTDHFPVTSVKKIGIPSVGPWKNNFITLFGRKMTPDDLEHDTLRKIYKDARIHFAVNCASVSCPSLRPTPYIGNQLESQLSEQATLFFNNKKENSFDPNKYELRLNSILKWFREDFTKTDDTGLVSYVAPYMPELASHLKDKNGKQDNAKMAQIKITYNDYDWALNGIDSL